jgi:Tfp pilus assembly protein PilV
MTAVQRTAVQRSVRNKPRNQRQRAGFTMIEVMTSLGLMIVGVMAITAMQQQTVRANVHAREITQATQVAETWLERLKLDASTWVMASAATVPPGTMTHADVLGRTTYLQSIVASPNTWMTIPIPLNTNTDNVSNGFDYAGRDVDTTANMAQVRYCASMRLGWVFVGSAMRADVRVWWPRYLPGSGALGLATDFPGCADDATALDPETGTERDNYHVVYLSTVIRLNDSQNN